MRRKEEVEAAHREVQAGIAQVEAALEASQNHEGGASAESLADARSRIEPLLRLARDHAPELRDEAARLHRLDQRIAGVLAEEDRAAGNAATEQAIWQHRLEDIQALINDKSYPEAKRLADRLAAEAAAPTAVSARARELSAKAAQALKQIFSGTRFGAPRDRTQAPPPR